MVDNLVEKKSKISIIGAGEVGTNLLKIFLKMDSIQVEYIADINSDAPGMILAQKEGIKTTREITEAVQVSNLDLILEVTNSKQVLETIKEEKAARTELISGECSYLIYNIIEEYKDFEDDLLHTVTDHLNEIYTAIESDSKSVNNLLAEIEDVTKHLNILAINASIEAARAGKEGQGFSVVANEVKDLSSESSHIVQKIEEINKNISTLNERITEVIDELSFKK
ncbi:methyl-accepting chemotaxis protein [Halobacteroides halobius DSM 5150]|uniref:Methyl-accepting chemotaxis protein n=1 Tax=Halobacteroides halobius (strain ATCC 35273 / DSM 5150 / MD-1) TaxID=748449 RepID=L0K989_HALHC|nr:methyl-accepting chemotaxis protein [Halobacteroides halobius]AGB41115.1 methyl-accepting chemotaxis protein [Halobacteroides halobius DSM 5150]